MRKKLVLGNWKMNGRIAMVSHLLDDLMQASLQDLSAQCVVIPPAIYLPLVQQLLEGSCIQWGAQNVYPADAGAYTGELSAPMLTDYNCSYVLVGHSERRVLFKESEKFITDKFHHVKEHDMIPVLCVGETSEEREKGLTERVLAEQINAVAKENAFTNCIIAYEPVWAIGTGRTATPEQVQEVHVLIRSIIAKHSEKEASTISLLYGGSVNEKNARSLFSMPDVDGGLIGGASLNAQQFVEIVKCIN